MNEKIKLFSLLEGCFPGIKANIIRCEELGFPWASLPFLKLINGEAVSHAGFLEYSLIIQGQQYKVGALHAICTQVVHRNQGLASELIQEALEWAKGRYAFVVLFTEIPQFYRHLSFHTIQEYRFHLRCQHPKGLRNLTPVISPKDNPLFVRLFKARTPASNQVWMKDEGTIASFNALFATYPTYWSLYYSSSFHGFLSCLLEDKTLHLFDVIADKIPPLDLILDHLPAPIDDIYFYFSPDRLTDHAVPEPYLYEKGHFMVHGHLPTDQPFMIPPLSRC